MARNHGLTNRLREPAGGGRRAGRAGDSGAAGPQPLRSDRNMTLAIGALLTLQAGALGLKAWDEKQTSDRAEISVLQAEALALAEQVNGRAFATVTAINLGRAAGASRTAIAEELVGVDAVSTLAGAAASPEGSRLHAAAETASALVEDGLSIGLSREGDVVVVTGAAGRAPMLALGPASEWLPRPVAGRRFTLSGQAKAGVGDTDLRAAAQSARTDRAAIQPGPLRTATACAGLPASGLSACSTKAVPLLARDDYIRLVIYALLLAAPALAILGLARRAGARDPRPAAEPVAGKAAPDPLQPILREARAGAWRWDTATDTLELDAAAASLLGFGRTPLSVQRHELYDRTAERFHGAITRAFEGAGETGRLQAIFATNSGQARFAEIRGGQIDADYAAGTAVFGGLVFDVSKAKQSDLKLRRAEERLRMALDGFSGPFALWDAKRRLVFWNRSFELDFGLQGELRAGIAQETAWLARAAAVRRERIVNDDNSTTLLELHDRRWLKMVEREIPDQGFITLGLDVTENVRNEDLLKQQKTALKKVVSELELSEGKNAELARKYHEEKEKAERAANTKSAFLANMSHELRTPLNAINGFSEMLVNELFGPLGDARYRSYAEDILTAGRHLLDLINDILDMSKIEAGKMTVDLKAIDVVDPVDAAVRIVRPKADEKAIDLELAADDDLPLIDADHRAMRQMVLNLVSNAIKFTPENGRIQVAVRRRGGEISIAVTDSGIGIAKDDLKRLGQPFEQVKQGADSPHKGTGLGLALTKSLTELHGGRMTMASEVGKGTRVTIYLPVPESGQTAAA